MWFILWIFEFLIFATIQTRNASYLRHHFTLIWVLMDDNLSSFPVHLPFIRISLYHTWRRLKLDSAPIQASRRNTQNVSLQSASLASFGCLRRHIYSRLLTAVTSWPCHCSATWQDQAFILKNLPTFPSPAQRHSPRSFIVGLCLLPSLALDHVMYIRAPTYQDQSSDYIIFLILRFRVYILIGHARTVCGGTSVSHRIWCKQRLIQVLDWY